MNEAELNIRQSLINTLTFLASEAEQLKFAANIYYASYQNEFSCWWFDTFFPDEPEASRMFSARQLSTLKGFSEFFDRSANSLQDEQLSIQQLIATPQWKAVVAKALETLRDIQNAA